MNDSERKPRRKKPSQQGRMDESSLARKPKKKIPSVYVAPHYPFWLGVASFAWTLVGWFIASQAPSLALMPMIGVLNYVFPAVTVGLIALNAYGALRNLWS